MREKRRLRYPARRKSFAKKSSSSGFGLKVIEERVASQYSFEATAALDRTMRVPVGGLPQKRQIVRVLVLGGTGLIAAG
ncbi:hypothetical protein LJR220_006150 [Bradyrhizobium sp. LjRoot220]|uniref:hypothetical protein n=1 Tax=Bradyrhizobium sp. LjRoot220 TaxID=3342284 RepID=UPI003ECC1F59